MSVALVDDEDRARGGGEEHLGATRRRARPLEPRRGGRRRRRVGREAALEHGHRRRRRRESWVRERHDRAPLALIREQRKEAEGRREHHEAVGEELALQHALPLARLREREVGHAHATQVPEHDARALEHADELDVGRPPEGAHASKIPLPRVDELARAGEDLQARRRRCAVARKQRDRTTAGHDGAHALAELAHESVGPAHLA